MRSLTIALLLLLAAVSAFFIGMSLVPAPSSMAASMAVSGEGGDQDSSEVERPVLVELFTSQGCSSCPPADALLSTLTEDPHRMVIPLSFHVDYWNRLGWKDPFSQAQWSERQRLYNEAMRTGRVYTPQLVVDGASHCVGSDLTTINRLLDEAASRPAQTEIQLDAVLKERILQVEVEARLLAGTTEKDSAGVSLAAMAELEIWLALTETGLETSVKTGENARRTLRNDFVVRELRQVSKLDMKKTSTSATHLMKLEEVQDLSRLSVVAFAQDPETRRIHGVALWVG